MPHYVFYLLYFICFCENWLIKGLGMLSHREPKWGQCFFSKVIHDLWVLQIQHTWVAILVIVFSKKREVNYVTFSFWRQDRETEHFWIKVFRFVILILHIEILTFQPWKPCMRSNWKVNYFSIIETVLQWWLTKKISSDYPFPWWKVWWIMNFISSFSYHFLLIYQHKTKRHD